VLEQVALGRARSAMLEQVRALPLTGQLNLGRWAAASVELDRALRAWVRAQPRHAVPRHYSDGVCEIDLRLEPEVVRDELLKWLTDEALAPPDSEVKPAAIKSAVRRWPTLWTTGAAQPSPKSVAAKPPGWEDITNEGLELARAAAVADANRALLEQAARLKVTHARRLREFFDSSEAVRVAVSERLLSEAATRVTFDPDQVAAATARIEVRRLPQLLADVHASHYQGDAFQAADFREMLLLAGREELAAVGLATPPDRTAIRDPYPELELDTPEWAARSLTASGRFSPGADSTPDAAAQTEAAPLAAIDRLRREVEKLALQENVTVSQFVSYHQELKDDIVLWLSGARPVAAPRRSPEGSVEVTVELPLRRLWEIVRRGLDRVEVEPAEAERGAATRPATPAGPAGKETP
jgi:hypothetical protein